MDMVTWAEEAVHLTQRLGGPHWNPGKTSVESWARIFP